MAVLELCNRDIRMVTYGYFCYNSREKCGHGQSQRLKHYVKRAGGKDFVVIPPCPYASGGEMKVVSQIPGIHRIIYRVSLFGLPCSIRCRTAYAHPVASRGAMGGDMFTGGFAKG